MFKVLINNQEFTRYTRLNFQLTYDAVASSFTIEADNNPAFKELFRPLAYHPVKVYAENGEILLTGVITNHEKISQSDVAVVQMSGYSKPGILLDVNSPTSNYPLQDDGKSLKDIFKRVIEPFGITLLVNPVAQEAANTTVEQAGADEVANLAEYLAKLSAQFNIILGHTSSGQLLLTKTRANEAPSAEYEEGKGNFLSAQLSTDGRAIHSSYTVLKQPDFGDTAETNPEETVNNTLISVFRPKVIKQTQGGSDVTANAAISARMAGLKAVRVTITVEGSQYPSGNPIRPNRTVKLTAPSINIDTPVYLFVQKVDTEITAERVETKLTCLLADALTGRQPKNPFN